MAREAVQLSNSELATVSELDLIANNSVIYKSNGWVYTALTLWANGTVLTSSGATSAPTFSANWTGDVSKVWTPVDNQVGVWTWDGTIEWTVWLTYDWSNLWLTGDIGITWTRITKWWFTDLEVTNSIAWDITGNAGTVSTITWLAPDTATTQATQASITTCTNLTTVGTIWTGTWEGTDVWVAHWGTGVSSLTAYAVICWWTTWTWAVQSIASVWTADQVLTSNWAWALPTFQAAAWWTAPQVQFVYDGEVPVATILAIPIHTAFTASWVRISVKNKPGWQDFKLHITKNGTASTDSIITSDATIDIATGASLSNWLYQTVTTCIDNWTFAAWNVLYIIVNQQWSTTQASDLTVQVY